MSESSYKVGSIGDQGWVELPLEAGSSVIAADV